MDRNMDLIVIGAGPAGLSAACAARACGLDVTLVDEQAAPGGQLFRNIETPMAQALLDPKERSAGLGLVKRFRESGATYYPGTTVWGLEPHRVSCTMNGKAEELAASHIIVAPGGMERPVPFPGWTLPGVMGAGGADILLRSGGTLSADKNAPVVLAGNGPLLLLLAGHLLEAGVPIAAPSANRSGKPSTTTAAHVLHDMDGRIEAILDGGPCEVGVESTIVDLTGERPRLLRPGGVTPEELRALLGELDIDRAVLGQISNDAVVRAPGMKYKHYAPSAEVYIISGSSEAAARYIRRRFGPGDAVLCFAEELPLYDGCNPTAYGSENDVRTLSAGLFAALRDLDRPDIRTIYARCPEGGGVAYAVGNRLKKAAAFRVVDAEHEA